MQRVGVKFCGHCQPYRNMVELLEMLRQAAPDIEFVRWQEPGYSILLVLQACDVACADIPPFAGPRLDVVESTVDFVEYDTDEALIKAILHILKLRLAETKATHDA